MYMASTKEFKKRYLELLEELDALGNGDQLTDDQADDLDDLNAEFEDAILLLDALDPESPDFQEELEDALDEFDALAGDYRDFSEALPELAALADRLEGLIALTRNLGGQAGVQS